MIPKLVTWLYIQIAVCIEGRDMILLVKIAASHKPSFCDVTDGTVALLPDRRQRPSSPLGVPCSLFCTFPNAWKVQQSIGCSKKLQRLSSRCKCQRQQASLNSSQLGKSCTLRRHFAHAASCRAPHLLESAVPLLLPAAAGSCCCYLLQRGAIKCKQISQIIQVLLLRLQPELEQR